MDVDRSGLVSLRELQRVLCGDTFRTLDAEFDHPDVGIAWSLDSDNCVCISQIEKYSPAAANRNLINGLRLYSINDVKLKMFQKKSLEKLQHEMIKIHDDPVTLKFVEPLYIITKMTCSLDVQVYGKTYTAWLPIGAVCNVTVMEQNIYGALCLAHRDFKHIEVKINRKTLAVSFFCAHFPFCLQFGTGENFQSSCRYAIGFSAFDTPVKKRHTGHDMTINLNLGLSSAEMDILMSELFSIFDADGSGEFQYEEFRDFHTKLLADDECVETLRNYAKYRFADLKLKAKQQELFDQRRAKMKKRFLLREKNKEIHAKQSAKRKANSAICGDGISRRLYTTRNPDKIKIVSSEKLTGKTYGSVKTGTQRAPKAESTMHKDREKMKERKRLQELEKQRQLNELAELNREQEREAKRHERDVTLKSAKIHMAEVLYILRKVYSKGFNKVSTSVEGVEAMGLNQDKIISPALKVSSNMFTEKASIDDIDIEEMESTEIHPSAGKYFFMREKLHEKYNVYSRHPCFFGADISREASRHSSLAMGVCRAALSQRQTPMSKVDVIKHPLAIARMEEIDRLVIERSITRMIDRIEVAHEVAVNFVSKIVSNIINGCAHDDDMPDCGYYNSDSFDDVEFMCHQYDQEQDVDAGSALTNDGSQSASNGSIEASLSVDLEETDDASRDSSVLRGSDGLNNNIATYSASSIPSAEGGSSLNSETERVNSKNQINESNPTFSANSIGSLSSDSRQLAKGDQKHEDYVDMSGKDNIVAEGVCESNIDGNDSSDNRSDSNTSSESESSEDDVSDSDSYTETLNESTSFVSRKELVRQQRANVYNGLNNSLSLQLQNLSAQIEKEAKAKHKLETPAIDDDTKRIAFATSIARNAIIDGTVSYMSQCGLPTERYIIELKFSGTVFDEDATVLDTSIHHNTASALVNAICNFSVSRVVDATKGLRNFWAYGTDIYNAGEDESADQGSENMRLKAMPRRQGAIREKIDLSALAPQEKPRRPKRREGIVLKRVTADKMATLRNDDSIDDDSSSDSDTAAVAEEAEKPKNILMGIHSISSFKASSSDCLASLKQLSPRIRARVTYGKWKVYSYECDSPRQIAGNPLAHYSWTDMDVENRELWNDIELRNHQSMHIAFTDGSNRVNNVICEGIMTFDDIYGAHQKFVQDYEDERRLKKAIIDNQIAWDEDCERKPFNVPLTMKLVNDSREETYLEGAVNMTLNVSGGDWIFPRRSEEYWQSKRSQHWTTYPLVPTATGVVRQRFRELANDYDKMKLIHPAFWGFSVRWKGPAEDEVRFIHPMFSEFSLVKKPTSLRALEEIDLNARKKIKVNPFKWKPIQECKVCYAKVPGCPRCWEMPLKKNGERCRAVDFQYDPDLEVKKANELKVRQAMMEEKKKARVEAMRALRDAGELDYDSDDTVDNSVDTDPMMAVEEKKIELHTQLTTEYALELYRKRALNLLTLYVKIAPGGYIRRLVVDPEDTIWHVHNMVKSHCDLGNARGGQFILPTTDAFYECDADIIPEGEYIGARVTADIKLKEYGLRARGSTITMLYFPRYKENTITPLMRNFMRDNLDIRGMNLNLPILKYIHNIPERLEKDNFQVKLCTILKRQFDDQEMVKLARLRDLGSVHRKNKQKDYLDFVNKKQQEKLEASRAKRDFDRYLEKQLKGLSGDEKEEKRQQILEEHFSKSEGTDEERKRIAKLKKDAARAEKLKKKRELIGQGLLSKSDCTSKVKNVINESFSPLSSVTKWDDDFKNKTVSFVDESSRCKDDEEDVAGPIQNKIEVPPLLLSSSQEDESESANDNYTESYVSNTSKSFPNLRLI